MCRNRVRSDKEMVGTGIVCKLESIAFLTFLASLFCIFICKLYLSSFHTFFFFSSIYRASGTGCEVCKNNSNSSGPET